jgi:hypothetical protein
VVPD